MADPGTKRPRTPLAITADEDDIAGSLRLARTAEDLGVDELWLSQLPDQRDAGAVAVAVAAQTERMRIATGVLPIRSRHPTAMAQLAGTVDELSGGRFILGLGLSHPVINEYMLGLSPVPPIRAVREYTAIVRDCLRDGKADYSGRIYSAHVTYQNPRPDVPIYLAGLRRQMIRLAVEIGDGLLLWMCTAGYIRENVTPTVAEACADFGRDPRDFPVLAIVLTCCSRHPAKFRARAGEMIAGYAAMPYYRRILAASGFGDSMVTGDISPEMIDELTIAGGPDQIKARFAEFRAAGAIPVPAPMVSDRGEFISTVRSVCDA
jgi:5,10-methylenetetrahydromethanopterin reductase